ncbi:xanthine dehydrogenase accessory protein XdhC [Consotaella salsifontis]|uniref:Molybdenum cofactor sulfurylase n=1 Tax=Consotaella salsifontis TaxID=1365950 RepID=A0A1T4SR46_9HYPH|nr:xanthine dehydrogenase accessory protein XdhC [Consotaella salsifontis]SKA30626.1 molybdenum cofactor sulfurylase [Consotaella salsifontis]
MSDLIALLRGSLAAGEPAALVEIAEIKGSTPREAGALMLVTPRGIAGTIGGGALEFRAIDAALVMLADGRPDEIMELPLGPELGQCCGGWVSLHLSVADGACLARLERRQAEEAAARPSILIFGAGHVGRALAQALALLPFRISLIDTRAEMLAGLPSEVETHVAALPESLVGEAPAHAAYAVMTHDHALDFLIAEAALRRGDAAYVGMIGSATKREQFRRHLVRGDLGESISRLTLPIGGSSVKDKRPAVIAALAAAEMTSCLLLRQQEIVTDRLAAAPAGCNSAAAG